MRSRATDQFWRCFNALPQNIQEQAKDSFRLFQESPDHPSLHFKLLHTREDAYSVRISASYRAVGYREGDEVVWFWAGPHDEYEKLLKHHLK